MSPLILLPSEVAAPFTGPGDISGLQLWLDGRDQTTVFQDPSGTVPALDQDLVARWNDKSGNGYDYTNIGDPNELPTWLDSSDEMYYGDLGAGAFCQGSISDQGLARISTPNFGGAQTVICVVQLWAIPGPTEEWSIWRTQDGSGNFQELKLKGSSFAQPWTFCGNHTSTQAVTVGCDNGVLGAGGPPKYILTYTYNGGPITNTASYQFRVSGGAQSLGAGDAITLIPGSMSSFGSHADAYPIASGDGMEGTMGELIIYDSVLSAGDIANVEGYLTSKYNWVMFDT